MKNVLVTGGAGFIGSNFVHFLLQKEPEITLVNVDALTYAGSMENLRDLPAPERHVFIKGSITDSILMQNIFDNYHIDTVVHFAAETHVDRSILDPGIFVETNVKGTFSLLEAARKAWLVDKTHPLNAVRFHHVSTDEVFGTLSNEEDPFNEDTPYAPRSPYAASKASADHFVRAYHTTFGLPISISNCSNNFGPRQFPEKLIPLMILNAVNGKPLPVYGDGKQIRDWLFVNDHCEAIRRIIKQGEVGRTYCIGGDNQPTNLEIIRLICSLLDELSPNSPFMPHEQLITHVPDRPGHDRRYDISINRIGEELGWEPEYSLEQGMRLTVDWYLQNKDWVKSINQSKDYNAWMEKNYSKRTADSSGHMDLNDLIKGEKA